MKNTKTTRARDSYSGQYVKEQAIESYIFGWPRYTTVYGTK
jgi:hypothetical protein